MVARCAHFSLLSFSLGCALLQADTPVQPPRLLPQLYCSKSMARSARRSSHYFRKGSRRPGVRQHVGNPADGYPGGLDTAMRDIIKDILASPIPIVTFVAPSGARAASAGTYILYASHVAAMAPATNLGSATPVRSEVSLPARGPKAATNPLRTSPGDRCQGRRKDKEAKGRRDERGASAMERKVINDAAAYLRSLAQLRGRNVEWAEKAVREGANLPATEALDNKVIDLIAKDLPDLLQQLDGRKLRIGASEITLATKALTLEKFDPDWRTELLAVITNPTIAYGLLLIGIYGLLFEGLQPRRCSAWRGGSDLPAAGAVCVPGVAGELRRAGSYRPGDAAGSCRGIRTELRRVRRRRADRIHHRLDHRCSIPVCPGSPSRCRSSPRSHSLPDSCYWVWAGCSDALVVARSSPASSILSAAPPKCWTDSRRKAPCASAADCGMRAAPRRSAPARACVWSRLMACYCGSSRYQ